MVEPCDTVNVILECIESGKYFELFPEKVRDTVFVATKEDTSTVLKDWATLRVYEETIIDNDTIGTATVKAEVQYNRLESITSNFVPTTKVVTEPVKVKYFSPFLGGGITTTSMVGQAGMFFEDKYGFSLLYQYDWKANKNSIGTMFLYKF